MGGVGLCVGRRKPLPVRVLTSARHIYWGASRLDVCWLRVGGALPVPELILPVGISFYTFQTMSYTIDLYRGQSRPASSFLHFAAYVSLFPQLIAGPIVRKV